MPRRAYGANRATRMCNDLLATNNKTLLSLLDLCLPRLPMLLGALSRPFIQVMACNNNNEALINNKGLTQASCTLGLIIIGALIMKKGLIKALRASSLMLSMVIWTFFKAILRLSRNSSALFLLRRRALTDKGHSDLSEKESPCTNNNNNNNVCFHGPSVLQGNASGVGGRP